MDSSKIQIVVAGVAAVSLIFGYTYMKNKSKNKKENSEENSEENTEENTENSEEHNEKKKKGKRSKRSKRSLPSNNKIMMVMLLILVIGGGMVYINKKDLIKCNKKSNKDLLNTSFYEADPVVNTPSS